MNKWPIGVFASIDAGLGVRLEEPQARGETGHREHPSSNCPPDLREPSRGVGPAGQYLLSARPEQQEAIRSEYFARIGEPTGSFELSARAWGVRGRVG